MSSDQYFTGTRVEIRVDPLPHDITTADSVLILYNKPNGIAGEWTGEKFGDQIKYTTSTVDVTTPGTWKLQACAVYGSERKKGSICYVTFDTPLN